MIAAILLALVLGLLWKNPAEENTALQPTLPVSTEPSAAFTEPEAPQPGVNQIEIRYQEAVAL